MGGRGNHVLRRGLETWHGSPLHRRLRHRPCHVRDSPLVAVTPGELHSYLEIGQGMHREEAVDIRTRPGQITFTSGSTHRHEVRCDTTDFEAVAEAPHTRIR